MKKTLLILVAMALLTSSPVWAKRGGKGGFGDFQLPPGKWWRMPEAVSRLNLTADEQNSLDEMYVQSRRKTIDLKSNLEKERLELEVLVNAAQLDENACRDRFSGMQAARSALAAEWFNHVLEVRKLLGYDRYQILKEEFQKRRMKRMKQRGMQREFMNPPGPGKMNPPEAVQ